MKKVLHWLRSFFFRSPTEPWWKQAIPYLVLGLLTVFVILVVTEGWDYTNSTNFCGTTCHTMPPQYHTNLQSPHARVTCVECHLGRAPLPAQIERKIVDGWITFSSLVSGSYEFPITAKNMRPANEACETCHYPQKFSDDSMRQLIRFAEDKANTPTYTYLILKTGGGSERQGLGKGIHWHIENEVVYLALDVEQQQIPYMWVKNQDGSVTEYLDIENNFDLSLITEENLHRMDCITCHNRTSHEVKPPEEAVDQLLANQIISTEIPEIRRTAVEVLSREYVSQDHALKGIAVLTEYYKKYYPDFYEQNKNLVDTAITVLQETFKNSVFRTQEFDWNTHPNNIGHENSPGCFRCHDGKHFNPKGEAVRLECNLCHSIPVVSAAADQVSRIEISRGNEPASHLNPNWIIVHRDLFDNTCATCHTVEDPGGASNTSFCSNSACHGKAWEQIGLDAPAIRKVLLEQLATPIPEPDSDALVFNGAIAAILKRACGTCHGQDGSGGLNLITYEGILKGGLGGPAIIPGDDINSLILTKTTDGTHFSQFTEEDLQKIKTWILNGAPENGPK